MFEFKVEMLTGNGQFFATIVKADSLNHVFDGVIGVTFPGDIVTVTRI